MAVDFHLPDSCCGKHLDNVLMTAKLDNAKVWECPDCGMEWIARDYDTFRMWEQNPVCGGDMSGLKADAVFNRVATLGRFVEVNITPGVAEGAEDWIKAVFARSQELVAVDTGELKASGEIIPTRNTGKTIVCGLQYTANHAAFVEYGTGVRGASSAGAGDVTYSSTWPGMPAQPYVRNSYDEYKDQAPDMIRNKIEFK